jgi:hypothetical protein
MRRPKVAEPPTASPSKSESAPAYKIFPRNLTARAAYIVPGNPANSRPESGVDNCYPGLEFDQRNLEQRFFPGLVFYYHRLDGAMLIEAPLTDEQRSVLKPEDLSCNPPLYLWGMMGRHLVQEPEPSMVSFLGQSGIEVWRRIHDLLPGTVAIVVGPKPGVLPNLIPQDELKAVYDAAKPSLDPSHPGQFAVTRPLSARFKIARASDGFIQYIMLADQRAPYLSPDGVLDPQGYPPGDLTKTMCAPWMYDFRDCLCFFWSSNKPDIVDVPYEGKVQPYVNFLRSVQDRSGPPKPDVGFYQKTEGDQTISRIDFELNHQNMVEGWSQKLPVVLDDCESPDSTASATPEPSPVSGQWNSAGLIAELTYLATVEHALTVEYLYAYYSVNAPRAAAGHRGRSSVPYTGSTADRIADAAHQLLAIATDEMRHLIWVNLALKMLGAPPSVGRARCIGEPPQPEKDHRQPLVRAGIQYLDRPFTLAALTAAKLDWFIEVEAPSKVINEGPDGMYVYILENLELRKKEIPSSDRLIPLIKLIIDEGHGHWERFTHMKQTLQGIPEEVYLHPLKSKPPNVAELQNLEICDAYYRVLLNAIELSVSLDWDRQPQLVEAAVRLMRNLDEMAVVTADHGYLPRFTLPVSVEKSRAKRPRQLTAVSAFKAAPSGRARKLASAIGRLDTQYDTLAGSLCDLAMAGEIGVQEVAARHRRHLAEHIAEVDAILMRSLPRPHASVKAPQR